MAVFNGNYQQGDFLATLAANNLTYDVYDLGQEHIKYMLLKHQVAKELERAFKAEGNAFVWENLMAESFADLNFPELPGYDPKTRYLYMVKKPIS